MKLFFLPPIVLVGTVYLLVHQTYQGLIFFVLLVILNYLIREISRVKHGVALLEDCAIKLNDTFEARKLTELDVKEVSDSITTEAKRLLASRYSWVKKSSGMKRAYVLNKERPIDELPIKIFKIEDDLPFTYRCYANHYTWNVIVTNLDFSEMTATQKFLILHEMGHATLENVSLYARKFSVKLEGVFLFILILFVTDFNWQIIIYAPLLFVFFLRIFDRATVKAEVNADIWALHQFSNMTDLKRVSKTICFILGLKMQKLDYKKFLDKDLEFKEEYNKLQIVNEETKVRIFSIKNYVKKRISNKISSNRKLPPMSISFNIFDVMFYGMTIYLSFFITEVKILPLFFGCILLLFYIIRTYSDVSKAESDFVTVLNKMKHTMPN